MSANTTNSKPISVSAQSVNLDAELHEGYDPNADLGSHAILFGKSLFPDHTQADSLQKSSGFASNISNSMADYISGQTNQNGTSYSALQGDQSLTAGNRSFSGGGDTSGSDQLGSLAGGILETVAFSGGSTGASGGEADSAVPVQNANYASTASGGGGTTTSSTPSDPGSNPGPGSGPGTQSVDSPVVTASAGPGHEDQPLPLSITVTSDSDPGITTVVTITGLPAGSTLSAGAQNPDGSWTLNPSQLPGLTFTPPLHGSGNFTLSITATSTGNGETETTTANLPVSIAGDATPPTLSVTAASGNEDTAITLNINAALVDTDGSETLSIMVTNLPAGFVPTVGINNGDGTWTIPTAQLGSFGLKPPANWSGDATYTVVAVSTEREGDSTIHTVTGNIHVNAIADAPTVTPPSHIGNEDSPLALNLGIALQDSDGSENISAITISGVPAGFALTNATDNHNGTWSVAPAQVNQVQLLSPVNWSGDLNLTVSATSQEGSSGPMQAASGNLAIHINGHADAPMLNATDSTGNNDGPIGLHVTAGLTDTDGSEHLSVTIQGVPTDAVLSQGLNNGDGTWTLRQDQLTNLFITAPQHFTGDIALTATAYSFENNGEVANVHQDFVVHVTD